MPRRQRVHNKGFTQHIIQRGLNRNRCFFADEDYQYYLDTLKESAEKTGCDIHAYVLMTNHIHLLVTPNEDYGISHLMKWVGQRYTQYVNYVYHRTGTIWEGRYKASVIDAEEYLLTCYKYIELNPVRANMVRRPSNYRWSSASWHGFAEPNEIITDHPLYLALGDSAQVRAQAYRQLFITDIAKEDIDYFATIFS